MKVAILWLCVFLFFFSHNNISLLLAQVDYFTLSLFWPPGKCMFSACNQPIISHYTIHGLWPQCYSGSRNCNNGNRLVYCTSTAPTFDLAMLQADQNLEASLRYLWPTLYCHGTDEGFWMHEWNKHGTCSFALFQQNDYFWHTLSLSLTLVSSLNDALTNAGLSAGGPPVELSRVHSEIETLMRRRADIICETNTHEITEVRFCFDSTGQNSKNCTSKLTGGASPTYDPFVYLHAA